VYLPGVSQAIFPTGVTTGAEALAYVGVKPGQPVYLKGSLGDYNVELNKSVTLYAGHPGWVDEVYLSSDGWWKVRVKILNSEAQPYLIWCLEDFVKSWTTQRPEISAPVMLDRYERLERDVLGRQFES
jgi:hypothetical protein